jgi:hypothetical protein
MTRTHVPTRICTGELCACEQASDGCGGRKRLCEYPEYLQVPYAPAPGGPKQHRSEALTVWGSLAEPRVSFHAVLTRPMLVLYVSRPTSSPGHAAVVVPQQVLHNRRAASQHASCAEQTGRHATSWHAMTCCGMPRATCLCRRSPVSGGPSSPVFVCLFVCLSVCWWVRLFAPLLDGPARRSPPRSSSTGCTPRSRCAVRT